MIRVIDGGVSTTVQDGGRFGLYHIGMPPSGALDDLSFRAANLLVGNDETSAVLEATYNGPRLEFGEDRLVAVTGADMPAKIDGEERPAWEAFPVRAGETLHFDYLRGGARAYIAVAGGIDVPEVLGSRSTYTLTRLGGFCGRPITGDDDLLVGATASGPSRTGRLLEERFRPTFTKEPELRVVMGLCDYRLKDSGAKAFLEAEWTVTTAADRVGYRYHGVELEFVEREPPFGAGSDPSNVVDVGYPVGSVQVPGGIEPIVLLNDAVTGGGYATIATVISADREKLAQSKPPDRTHFVAVTLEAALQARAEKRRKLESIRERLR